MLTFGTDGVRGEFGKELTETYAANLAEVAAQVLQCKKVVIGRDTRGSGSALENAIAEALTRIGVEVQLMGVAPTPAIAFAAHSMVLLRSRLQRHTTCFKTTESRFLLRADSNFQMISKQALNAR